FVGRIEHVMSGRSTDVGAPDMLKHLKATSRLPTMRESARDSINTSAFDRHRGGGHPPTPATPPCVRVRTRRFELVTLACIDQRWKSERGEVSIGKPHREGFGPGQIPGAESAASRVLGQSRANPQC